VTDQSDESAETPEIAEVRRLLADARHTEPMPDDVATRMDDVLAGLAAEPGPSATRRPNVVVLPIAAHRRRKVAGLLVAAAVVVVGGFTIAPHLTSGTASSPSSATDAAGESNPANTGSAGAPNAQPKLPPDSTLQLERGLVVIRPDHFPVDARQGRDLLRRHATEQQGDSAKDQLAPVTCPDVPGPGQRLAAEYRQAPAILVYRPVEGGTQVVDLYVCGDDRPVRSTTLPAP
jgi:hypothetical protein